jgi:hypothetical protein
MKSEFLYLHHIRERCGRVRDCVRTGREEFFGNVVYQDAVMRIHDYPDLDWSASGLLPAATLRNCSALSKAS